MKRRIVTLLVALIAVAIAVPTEGKRNATKRKARTTTTVKTRPATSARYDVPNPFKGKWSSTLESMEIDLYKKCVVDPVDGSVYYGIIEGCYNNGNRLDSHMIEEVVNISGNTAVVRGECSFGGPFTATLTYNPANGKMTVKTDIDGMCYQSSADGIVLKKK